MNSKMLLLAAALVASLAGATRQPANLAPFDLNQVCVGRAEAQVRGQPDTKLSEYLQGTLKKLAAEMKLGGNAYVECPAWLTLKATVKNDGNGKLVYAATLELVSPKLLTQALGNLKDETFDYDGGFDFVSLWASTGYNIAGTTDDLKFRLNAELVDLMGQFRTDWQLKH